MCVCMDRCVHTLYACTYVAITHALNFMIECIYSPSDMCNCYSNHLPLA